LIELFVVGCHKELDSEGSRLSDDQGPVSQSARVAV
jgi:hypothetical protein